MNLDRDFLAARPTHTANSLNSECMMACRQKHLLPSSQRIINDMNAFENKFYERYLSSGYKL